MRDRLEVARELLGRSRRTAVFSGAGLSAESGVSTFRDPAPDALWSRFDPTELASVEGFSVNPQRVIEWYNWRRARLAGVQPNAAHRALANQPGLIQITQNVDSLLEQAGVAAERVLHLHGSIQRDRCHNPSCGHAEPVDFAAPQPLRACPRCGDYLRPAVVWFGEPLPRQTWLRAEDLCRNLDCLLVVGTSAMVYPAAGLIELARAHGSRIVVVDPAAGAAGAQADIHLDAAAGEVLPALIAGLDLRSPG